MNKFIELLQSRPLIAPLLVLGLLIIGIAIGLPLGWMTVEFRPSADDVVMVADSFALNPNVELAKARLKGLSKTEQETLLNRLIEDRTKRGLTREAERLTTLGQALGLNVSGVPGGIGTLPPATRPSGASSSSASAQPTPSGGLGMLPIILGILFVVLLIAAAGLIFVVRILPMLRKPRAPRAPAVSKPSVSVVAPPGADLRYGAAPAPTTSAGELGRFVPTYTLGNDNYDTSFSLETAKGEFLGECGMGVSETIGEGKPDKVTAFDLWLFDKADVRTVTQILMSDYAFKDPAIRTKLATKGEAVLAEKGKTLHLETQSLAIDAHIVELVYATNPSFPPNSHFQKLVVEIVPTHKDGAET